MMKNFALSVLILSFSTFTYSQSESEIIASQIKEAKTITNKWMEKQKAGISRRDQYEGQVERADYIISGIPKQVKQVNPQGVVYRHYVGKNMQIILESSQLKTGITPYVIMNPGYSREVYVDLVGIFLTTPQTPPERVGLPRNNNADYIDFTLYEGTPVVEVEKEILLIPGRPDMPEWLKAAYAEYKKTGRTQTQYVELFTKVDERGGVTPTFMKVKITSYRLNGVIKKL
jgi:hypothetical protein